MAVHPLAGNSPSDEQLVDLEKLQREYHTRKPDLGRPDQRVTFGTKGHPRLLR